jgi:hypothetical protein
LNSEVEQMGNQSQPQFNVSSRSVPEVLGPLNITCPESWETYLLSTIHLNEDTLRGKQWEIKSYQFYMCTNNQWFIPLTNQYQLNFNEALTLNQLKFEEAAQNNIPEEANQSMNF